MKMKRIIIMVLIGAGWLTAVYISMSLRSTSSSYYQLNPEDTQKIEREIQQLQKIKAISSKRFTSKTAFLSELERVLGKKPDKRIENMLSEYAWRSTFSDPKMMIMLPAILFGSALWFWIIRLHYPMTTQRIKYLCWLGIFGGALSSELGLITNSIIQEIMGDMNVLSVQENPIRTFVLYLLCATGEEFWKFLFCYLLIRRSKVFRQPIDGLVVAMMVGLGFATFENFGYVFRYNYDVLFARYLLTAPAHLCFSGIWGYGLAEARFKRSSSSFAGEIWPYLGLASVLHFVYNYFFSAGMAFFFFFALIMTLTLILFFHNQLLKKRTHD